MDPEWHGCIVVVVSSQFFGTARDLCRFAATSKSAQKLVSKHFEHLVLRHGLLLSSSSYASTKLWCSLLKPEALARVWASGIQALATPSSSRIEIAVQSEEALSSMPEANDDRRDDEDDEDEDFVLVPRRSHSTTALAGLDMGLQVRDCLSLDSCETKARLEEESDQVLVGADDDDEDGISPYFFQEGRRDGIDYCYEYECGYGISIPRKARCVRTAWKGLRECGRCGLWFFSCSGRSIECVRCRRHMVFLSPAREVLLNHASTFRGLVETARNERRRLSSAFETIRVDVPRTTNRFRIGLTNILEAYAIFCPCVGYCQGMSHVALRLLRRLDGDEERTFWAFAALMDRNGLKAYYLPGLRRVRIACFQLDRLVDDLLPRVSECLARRCGVPSLGGFSISHFQTLLADALPEKTADAIFDAYSIISTPSGSLSFLLRVILAMLHTLEPLLEETEDPLRLLKRGQQDHFDSPRQLLARADSFKSVDEGRVELLEKQFNQNDPHSSIEADTHPWSSLLESERTIVSPARSKRTGLGGALEHAYLSFFSRAAREQHVKPVASRLVVIDIIPSSKKKQQQRAALFGGLDDDDDDD